MIISHSAFSIIINISEKSCLENQNIRFTSNFFFFENRAVYEIMSKNIVVGQATDGNIIRRMRSA